MMATRPRSDRLTKSDIKTVRKEVLAAAAKYYDLGIELGLDPDYLDTLTSKSDEDNLRDLLVRWLSGVDPEPTWQALCEALRNPAIKHEALAEEIEEKYCKKVESKDDRGGKAIAIMQSRIIEQPEEDSDNLKTCILTDTGAQTSDVPSTPARDNVQDSHRPKSVRPNRHSLVTNAYKSPPEVLNTLG